MEQDAIRRFGMALQAPDFTNEDMKLPPWTDISRKLYRVNTIVYLMPFLGTMVILLLIGPITIHVCKCDQKNFFIISGKENITRHNSMLYDISSR